MLRTLLLISMVIGWAGLLGCEQGLFAEELPRTQYERFDERRGNERPKEALDPRGYTKANLRGRLTTYE